MTNLGFVDIGENQLASLTMPSPLPQLDFLRLSNNKLTSLVLPPGMTNLEAIFLNGNQLTNITLASGMTNLVQLDLRGNQLKTLTLPPDANRLTVLPLDGNPLTTLILSETQAATTLAGTVATLRQQGVTVFTYPLSTQLISPRQNGAGNFQFTLTGPPGIYTVLSSTNLSNWTELGTVTNQLGNVVFTDTRASRPAQSFYQTRQ
jgi:hypothetical protein